MEIAKATGFGVSTALYATAVGLAIYELYQQYQTAGTTGNCKATKKSKKEATDSVKKKSDDVTSKLNRKQKFAKGFADRKSQLANKVFDNKYAQQVEKYISHPIGRIAVGSAMGVVSAYLMSVSIASAEITKERIKKVKKTRDLFSSATEGFGECEDRNDRANPICYCYNTDGTKNENRENSETCQSFWDKNFKIGEDAPDPEDYNRAQNLTAGLGCIKSNGSFDGRCECKKIIRPNGQNDCMKTTKSTLGINFGAGTVENQILGDLTKQYQNEFQGTNINPTNTGNFARTQGNNNKKLLKKLGNKISKSGLNAGNLNRAGNAFLKQSASRLSKGKIEQAMRQDQAPLTNIKTDKVLLADLKKVSNLTGVKNNQKITYQSAAKKVAKRKKENILNFDSGGRGVRGKVVHIKGLETNQYKHSGNDLHKGESGPKIWDLIKDRYQKSAYEKLFKD